MTVWWLVWAILFSLCLAGIISIKEEPHDPVKERIDLMNSRQNNR